MNEENRRTIEKYCDLIANHVDMIKLWPHLFNKRIFNLDDCNVPRWKDNLNTLETKKDIILTIKTRGPYAFRNFINSLRESNQEIFADILQEVV